MEKKKARIAFFDFADCEGCQLQVTYLNEAFLDLLEHVEIVNFRVAAVGKIPNPQIRVIESGSTDPSAARKGSRKVFDFLQRAVTEFSVYDRFALKAGNVVSGPALIEEPTTVTRVSEGSQCEVDKYGNLIIARGPSQSPQ